MSEILGILHILCGLLLLSIAVMVPVRATKLSGGLLIAGLFILGALERFLYGYHRLVDNDLRADSVALVGIVYASLVLVVLVATLVLVWRAPELQNRQSDQLDRMESAALKDQAASREGRKGAESDRVDAGIDQAAGREHRKKPPGD
jgi:hypothetical protein